MWDQWSANCFSKRPWHNGEYHNKRKHKKHVCFFSLSFFQCKISNRNKSNRHDHSRNMLDCPETISIILHYFAHAILLNVSITIATCKIQVQANKKSYV